MTLSELKKLAQSATPGPWYGVIPTGDTPRKDSWLSISNDLNGNNKAVNADYELIKALNPSTALRMIELLERAAGYIQNAELKECVNCPENSPTPIEECMQCQTARTAYKWIKDLEEL